MVDLGRPISEVRVRAASLAADVAMPEATMYENNDAKGGKDQIRLSWEIPSVKAIAESSRVDGASYKKFRPGVTTPDRRHVAAPSC